MQVLLVAGTHGNEINAPWLFDHWSKTPDFINTHGLNVYPVIGNPSALEVCSRYLDFDLNRSFTKGLLNSELNKGIEVKRAKELLSEYGPKGVKACQIAIDFHSTTSAMGNCLVVYGRRPADLALASLIQGRLGLPVYLHEGDQEQHGFLVEAWPCGLVVEVGPVPQGLLQQKVISMTLCSLEACLIEISKVRDGKAHFPEELIVHRHLGSIDFPRDNNASQVGLVHSLRQGQDWLPIKKGDPLLTTFEGEVISFTEEESVIPVFINEASYAEKHIAMSFTRRELWPFSSSWSKELSDLICI